MKINAHPRNWFARNLGVSLDRKKQIYLELCQSVTLGDISYWMQVLFSAGIATLGLVLNSPAVIIGAMLISPLMGNILANGLALAAGDVILALRAILNLLLSCAVAIIFAILLVSLFPFKEITGEILARTRPNLLDLGIALFSGAIGSLAICKKSQGVATSVPGVAIAVALMPPLCVVGFGIGLAISQNPRTGMSIAGGSGLLFLTNLVAITFMAMIVFWGLNIDTEAVKIAVRNWRTSDRESSIIRYLLERIPAFDKLRKLGGLPSRFLLIIVTILVISFPLNQSLNQLRQEIVQKRRTNRIQAAATEIWQDNFAYLSNGESRSYINQLSFLEKDGRLTVQIQVVTSQVYTSEERKEYVKLLAKQLQKDPDLINLRLVEVPTVSEAQLPAASEAQLPESLPTIAELEASFLQAVESALDSLQLPPPAQMINYEVIVSPGQPLSIQLIYLSQREISGDGQVLLTDEIETRLNSSGVRVNWQRISPELETLTFQRDLWDISPAQIKILERAGQFLQAYPSLQLQITANQQRDELGTAADLRSQAIIEYLQTKWQVPFDRIVEQVGSEQNRNAKLRLTVNTLQLPEVNHNHKEEGG